MFFDTTPSLDCAGRLLLLDRPRIMGIINVTPDSFSDGGIHASTTAAIARAIQLAEDGADILDIGGESTRPGADPVSIEEELRRTIPVIERLSKECSLPLSIDTSKPEVMRAAVHAGAGMINDVYALRREDALKTAAELAVPVCLMHMQGEPQTMQNTPDYSDVVAEVHSFLTQRLFACEMAGMSKKKLLIDPGFGFGKTLEHNLQLLATLHRFTELGVPVLAGLSRKSMIGKIIARGSSQESSNQEISSHSNPLPGQRLAGSVAAAVIAAQNGAQILRVHDVAETRDALAVWKAVSAITVPTKKQTKPTLPAWPDED